jgi:ribonuclease HI
VSIQTANRASAPTAAPRYGANDLAEFESRLSELVATLPVPSGSGPWTATTDGSCLRNPGGPGGWAVVVADAQGATSAELWGHLSDTSNNRGEILAVLAALRWVPEGAELHLRSDSEYVLHVLRGEWGIKANADLWRAVGGTQTRRRVALKTTWVRGHGDDEANKRADALALMGSTQGDAARAAAIGRRGDAKRATRRPKREPATTPEELVGLTPRGPWESQFLASVARQLRSGRALSEKQAAVLERMRR